MSSDAEISFLAKLRQGPSFLLLGQAYLKIQAAEDSLLTLILRKDIVSRIAERIKVHNDLSQLPTQSRQSRKRS